MSDDRIVFNYENLYAGEGHSSTNASHIDIHHNFNGSGGEAFGGAEKWPVVSVHVALPENGYGLATELAVRLSEVIKSFLIEKGLYISGPKGS